MLAPNIGLLFACGWETPTQACLPATWCVVSEAEPGLWLMTEFPLTYSAFICCIINKVPYLEFVLVLEIKDFFCKVLWVIKPQITTLSWAPGNLNGNRERSSSWEILASLFDLIGKLSKKDYLSRFPLPDSGKLGGNQEEEVLHICFASLSLSLSLPESRKRGGTKRSCLLICLFVICLSLTFWEGGQSDAFQQTWEELAAETCPSLIRDSCLSQSHQTEWASCLSPLSK